MSLQQEQANLLSDLIQDPTLGPDPGSRHATFNVPAATFPAG
ncbi:hypothetical protein ACFY5D_14865 [Paeniglutamicibacter sp. NPDC012692]